MRRTHAVLAALGLAALAGCVTPPPPEIPSAAAPLVLDAVERDLATSAPLDQEDAPAPARKTVLVEADARQLAHANTIRFHAGASGAADLFVDRARPLNGTLVVTWERSSPLDEVVEIWLYGPAEVEIAHGFGASPLVVEIDGAAFRDDHQFRGWVEPSQPGVLVDMDVHFALALSYAVPT